MSVLGFLWDNLALVVLVLLYIGAVAAAFIYGGRNLAVLVASIGIGHVLYSTGRKQERDERDERAVEVGRKREDAYRKIDERGTDRHDAADRLRKHDY